MSWLHKLAAQDFYYHGTSIANLQSILAEGLNSNHNRVFTPEFAPREHLHSIESMGGVYFTRNLMTAYGAGGKSNQSKKKSYGDKRVIVIARLENRTPHILPDEDAIPDPEGMINSAMHVLANGWFFADWIQNKYQDIDRVVTAYLDWFQKWFELPPSAQQLLTNLQPTVKNLIMAHANWQVAVYMKDDFRKLQYPEFANFDVNECEQKYRQHVDELTRKAHRVTSLTPKDSGGMRDNIRSMEPISYRGANRIVAIIVTADNPDHSYDENYESKTYRTFADIVYESQEAASAWSDFIKQYKERIGSNFILRNQNTGKIYYDGRAASSSPGVGEGGG